MSQSIFGSLKKTILGFLFGVLVIMLLAGLSMFGVTDAFQSQSKDAAATVGKEKVTLREFDDFFRRRLGEINKDAPERVTSKQAYQRGLHRQILDALVTEQLIQIDADNLGIAVNNRDAIDKVEELEVFNNEITGKLDKAKMLEVLRRIDRNKSPKELEKDIHKQIRREQTLASLQAGLVTPRIFADQQYKFMTEQRTVKLLRLTQDAVTAPPDPTEEELQAFIKDSPAGYIAPEYRRFTLLRMEIENVLPDVEVTNEEIKKHFDYKIKIGQLGTEETRSYQQLVANDKDQADKITAALNSGKDIASVVAEFSLDAPLVYDDVLPGASSDPKAGEAAFKMDKVSAQTVASSFGGWFSVVLTNITPRTIPDMEAERANLIEELQTNKAKQILYDASKAIQDGISEDSMTLEDAGRANGISVASYDFMSRLGKTEKGHTLEGLPNIAGVATDDFLLKEIFLADPGFDGDVFETTKEGIAAIRVDQIKDSAPRPFADVREQALQAWHLQKANEALATLSEGLIARANGGESLEDLAAEIGKGAEISEIMMIRAARTQGLGDQVIVRLFEAREKQIVRGLAANGLDRIIGQVLTITPNTDAIMSAISDTLTNQAAEAINSDIQTAYRAAVLTENPVQTMTANIERTLGLDQ
ncbi:MAG: SurA N-terminal domain-containing protein [Robiginitomaculum sp.]|nr:SurA N-terminal domain-containing protein [Robiginitomaculum sp.]